MPILKNEIKCLPPLPPLSKSSTVLHTFNSTILTPVSNNNSGFLRNLLNSSTGKVCISFIVCTLPSKDEYRQNSKRLEKLKRKVERGTWILGFPLLVQKAVSLAGGLHRVVVLGWAIFSCYIFSCNHFYELWCQVGEGPAWLGLFGICSVYSSYHCRNEVLMVGNDIFKTCVLPQIQTENGLKNTPKILDDIFASLVQSKTSADLPKRPQGLTIKPSILGFDTPHYWLCDSRLLCLQDPNNRSNWNVFRECWKQGQVRGSSAPLLSTFGRLWQPHPAVPATNCRWYILYLLFLYFIV